MNRCPLLLFARPLLVCLLLLLGMTPGRADLLISQREAGKIGKYRTDGSVLDSSFIRGLSTPTGILVSGSFIYVANTASGTIGRCNPDGSASAVSFITGLSAPVGLTTDGTSLYVANNGSSTIGKYNLSTGAVTNASLVTWLDGPQGVLIHQGLLFVTDSQNDSVKRYAPTGGSVQATLPLPAGSIPTTLASTGTGNISCLLFGTGAGADPGASGPEKGPANVTRFPTF